MPLRATPGLRGGFATCERGYVYTCLHTRSTLRVSFVYARCCLPRVAFFFFLPARDTFAVVYLRYWITFVADLRCLHTVTHY